MTFGFDCQLTHFKFVLKWTAQLRKKKEVSHGGPPLLWAKRLYDTGPTSKEVHHDPSSKKINKSTTTNYKNQHLQSARSFEALKRHLFSMRKL